MPGTASRFLYLTRHGEASPDESALTARRLMLTVTGVFFGTLAGVAEILPFSIVRTDSVLPDQGPAIWLSIVAVAAAATLITSLATAARALRTPAVAAVTA
jgi:putative ABC transport system permease protein